MKKHTFHVGGMSCANCAKTIENSFESYEDCSAIVNFAAGKVLVTYNEDKYTVEDLSNIIESCGYQVIEGEIDNRKQEIENKHEIIISIALTIPLLWTMWHHLGLHFVYVPKLFMDPLFQFILATPVQFYIGRHFYKNAYISVKNKNAGMDVLVVVGTTTAYLFSIYQWINFANPQLYFETSATIITVILIGKYMEHLASSRTSDALVELINLSVKETRVIRDDVELLIPTDEVVVGDQVIVLAHEKISVDGIVISGNTYVDESMITGESLPVYKNNGENVIGGTLNMGEKIVVETVKIGEDTVLSSIIRAVEEASLSKPPIQRVADKISNIFVPAVILLSITTFVFWYFLLNREFLFAFEAAVAVLVISCPCALGLATPTSVLVGSGKASERGILYKGAEYFEAVNKINAIAFDKTGTITKGVPTVTNYVGDTSYLSYLYTLENEATHPLANAVCKYAKDNEGRIYNDVIDFKTLYGIGVYGKIENHEVYVGSHRLLKELDLELGSYQADYDRLVSTGATVIMLIVNGEIKALVSIVDELKENAKMVIDELKRRDIKVFMITGDGEVTAKNIGSIVGIDNIYSNVLPGDKKDIVKEIQDKGYKVAFVGDGINDGPALKQADIGIALGSGTDVAISSSDITLINDDISLVINAIDLSKATLKNIYQNFFFAFVYNIIAIPFAFSGRLDPMIAGFAMAFSDITVVLNALRLKRFKFVNLVPEVEYLTVKIPTMSCSKCEGKIRNALLEHGYKNINVDLETKYVDIESDGSDTERIVSIIEDSGYKVEL